MNKCNGEFNYKDDQDVTESKETAWTYGCMITWC